MVIQTPICRIGVFYDGTHFSIAQRYFRYDLSVGCLSFNPFHTLLQRFVSSKERGFSTYKVVCASWHQGISDAYSISQELLSSDRSNHINLVDAGIEPKYLRTSHTQSENGKGQVAKEKGVDVALAVDALQTAVEGKIDVAVLVTGDGDFLPLVRALNKQGIRVVNAYFHFTDKTGKESFNSQRLANCSDYVLDVCALQRGDVDSKTDFSSLFEPANGATRNHTASLLAGAGSPEP